MIESGSERNVIFKVAFSSVEPTDYLREPTGEFRGASRHTIIEVTLVREHTIVAQ